MCIGIYSYPFARAKRLTPGITRAGYAHPLRNAEGIIDITEFIYCERLPLCTTFLLNSISARVGQRLSCTYGVRHVHAGEELFGFFYLGPEGIGLAAQCHELSVVSLRLLPV